MSFDLDDHELQNKEQVKIYKRSKGSNHVYKQITILPKKNRLLFISNLLKYLTTHFLNQYFTFNPNKILTSIGYKKIHNT